MVRSVPEIIKSAAVKLPALDSPSFGSLFDSFGGSRIVLIGHASHGTSEFYRARAYITQRLIQNHGFNIVAIEADWPDSKVIDRYVRQAPNPESTAKIPVFNHFPRWMWRNKETQGFVEWLRKHNARVEKDKLAGFFGLDLYSMGASIRAVLEYLERVEPGSAKVARSRYGCLEPWVEEPALYGRASLNKGFALCEKGVLKVLQDLLSKRLALISENKDRESYFDAEMNARVVSDSEKYYRAMYYGDEESWNLRDSHMFETLMRLLKARPESKAVVWAHNSHVGDARHTSMGQSRGELNIGQLCREAFASDPGAVSIIGCGTHGGPGSTVAAASEWDEPMEIMRVNPSREDSYERLMHDTGIPSFLLDLKAGKGSNEEVRQALMQPRLERFIGVIYRPDKERWSHYMKAILPKQLDAYVWFDQTSAVQAFETAQPKEGLGAEETYPFGL